MWNLSGVPCMHAISAIGAQKLNVDDFVHPYYTVDTYNKVYECELVPMNGRNMWEKTGYIPPLPPGFGKKRERPSKARRRGSDEESSGRGGKKQHNINRTPKQSWKRMWKWCYELGHIEKACQWKKFAEEFPADVEFGQNEPATQPADEMAQQPEKMTQANDIPPFTQDSLPDNTEDATHEHDLWKEFPIVPYSFFDENKTTTTNDCDVDTKAEL